MAYNYQQYLQDPGLEQLGQQAQQASQTAADYVGGAATLPHKLKEAVMNKMRYNKDLIEQQNQKMAEYFAAPSAAREKYQGIFNPFQREKLVAQEKADAYTPYANLTDLLSQRMGSINDIIGAGTAAGQGMASQAQSAAELANQAYANRFSYLKELMGAAQTEDKMNAPSGSGGTDLSSLFDLMGLMGQNQNEGDYPTEVKPNLTPPDNNRLWRSPEGQWIWDPTSGDWVPVTD